MMMCWPANVPTSATSSLWKSPKTEKKTVRLPMEHRQRTVFGTERMRSFFSDHLRIKCRRETMIGTTIRSMMQVAIIYGAL